MENRDSTIDIAKGICIFLMVLGHTYFYSWFNDRVYLFHMPFFFFVSGFFYSTKKNLKDFEVTSFAVPKINEASGQKKHPCIL